MPEAWTTLRLNNAAEIVCPDCQEKTVLSISVKQLRNAISHIAVCRTCDNWIKVK